DIYFKNDTGLWELLPSGGGVSVGSGGNGSFSWSPAPSYKKTNSQVRVWDNATNNISSTSNLFDIVGSLVVTAPNGGQNWAVGGSPLITWSRDSVTLVNISYSTDGGGSWSDLQNNFDTSGTTQWQWNIPNETNVSNNFYVKVEDAQNADATNDTSDSSSSVMSVFDVTGPEETTDFIVAGDSCDITWGYQPVSAANKSDNIILRYSTDGGGSWNDIPGANTTPNDGSFTWNNINGTVLSNETRIQVIQSDNYNAANASENIFDLRGNLTVDEPGNADVGNVGGSMDINWTLAGSMSTVKIEYSYDGGSSWKSLATSIAAANQTWPWSINTDENTTAAGKIKITDEDNANTTNISIGSFSIKGNITLTEPDGGEVLTYDGSSTAYVNWSYNGTIENVTLYYSNDSGSSWNTIDTVDAVNQTYNWTIPDDITGDALVRIADEDDASVNDSSDGTFGIAGSMLISYPNGGEDWIVGSADYVNWTPTANYSNNVIIEYYNGSVWNTLGTQAPGINGQAQSFSLPANVPDDITASAKARVSTNETNASINVNDECNSTYRIVGTVDVTVPNNAVTWFVGQSKTINWTSNGTVTPVLIQYSTNGTSGPWNNINGSYNAVSGANNYTWAVDDLKNQSTCYVKVTHNISGLTDINDTSDVGFTIFPQINVTEPQNNSNVMVENMNTPIRWGYSGSKISSVDIFYRQNVSSGWQNIAYDVSISQNNSYVWPSVPILRTTEAEVRVYDNDTYAVNGTSDEFNIIGKLNLTSPDASETNWIILTNTSQAEWTSAAVQTVKVYYSVNGSDGPWVYSKSVNGSAGVTNFDVPENVTNNASIKITDSSNENITYDISENNFSFVEDFQITQPEDNIALVCGQNYDIRWTRKSASALPNIKLEFFDGNNWSLIGGDITNSGEYLDWGVPNTTISTQCKVRVVSPISQANNNESSPPFTIRGDIAVTNPNTGNESWNVDATYPINWSYTGPITNVTIQYNYNGTNPSDWATVVTRVPVGAGGNGSWNWTINSSTPLSTTARIRAYDSDQNLTNDTNDFNFTI
ncbi:MAG: hypothetical protein KAQ99_03150, partial [Candidatus Aureabacteria bacterium]|nr:hypothetical protein [Candidatus Auribacterota bacterium]